MTAGFGHAELRDLLPAAALDIIEPEERDRILAHVEECDECARALDEHRRVTAELGMLLPSRPMEPHRSEAVRARLLARVRGQTRAAPRFTRSAGWAGWMVAAGLAGVVLIHHSVHRPVDFGWLVAGVLALGLVLVGAYADHQRRQASRLKERLESLLQRSLER